MHGCLRLWCYSLRTTGPVPLRRTNRPAEAKEEEEDDDDDDDAGQPRPKKKKMMMMMMGNGTPVGIGAIGGEWSTCGNLSFGLESAVSQ